MGERELVSVVDMDKCIFRAVRLKVDSNFKFPVRLRFLKYRRRSRYDPTIEMSMERER